MQERCLISSISLSARFFANTLFRFVRSNAASMNGIATMYRIINVIRTNNFMLVGSCVSLKSFICIRSYKLFLQEYTLIYKKKKQC